MANEGTKIARVGFDIFAASDNQLLYSSAFKTPLIVASGTYVVNNFDNDHVIFQHNLGYVPLALVLVRFPTNTGTSLLDNTLMTDVSSNIYITNYNDLNFTAVIAINDQKIWYLKNTDLGYLQGGTRHAVDLHVTYFVTNIPLLTDYTAPIIGTVDATGQVFIQNDYGFKASKPTKDALTGGLIDLVALSGLSLAGYPVRNLVIHAIRSGTLNNNTQLQIAHGLNYAPMFLVLVMDESRGGTVSDVGYFYKGWTQRGDANNGGAAVEQWKSWSDSSYVNIKNTQGNAHKYAVVIFKNPLI